MSKPRMIHTPNKTRRDGPGQTSLTACGKYTELRGLAFWGPNDFPCPKCAALALIASTNVEA